MSNNEITCTPITVLFRTRPRLCGARVHYIRDTVLISPVNVICKLFGNTSKLLVHSTYQPDTLVTLWFIPSSHAVTTSCLCTGKKI